MKDLIQASITTLIILIYNIFYGEKKSFVYYMIIWSILFFGCLGINKICADIPDAKYEIEYFQMIIPKNLSDKDKKFYKDKRDFHLENAERCYNDAKNKCWYLPNISNRDKGRYCFTTIIVLISPGNQPAKIILGLLNLLGSYGLDCIEEWNYIEEKLKWSSYHYEMYEFYRDLLIND